MALAWLRDASERRLSQTARQTGLVLPKVMPPGLAPYAHPSSGPPSATQVHHRARATLSHAGRNPNHRNVVAIGNIAERSAKTSADFPRSPRRDRMSQVLSHEPGHLPARLKIRDIPVEVSPVRGMRLSCGRVAFRSVGEFSL